MELEGLCHFLRRLSVSQVGLPGGVAAKYAGEWKNFTFYSEKRLCEDGTKTGYRQMMSHEMLYFFLEIIEFFMIGVFFRMKLTTLQAPTYAMFPPVFFSLFALLITNYVRKT